MSHDTLNTLRNAAQYIKLQPSPKYGGAVELNNLLDVLNSIQSSFNGFIEAQFHRSYNQSVSPKFKEELNKIKSETALLIVDLQFSSYATGFSPDLVTHRFQPAYLKIDDWKKEKFEEYKDEAFHSNYNSKEFINKIVKKYTAEERSKIFKPIIDNLQNTKGYTIHFGDSKHKYENKFNTIKDESIRILVPRVEKDLILDKLEKHVKLAKVEISNKRKNPKVLELFDNQYKHAAFSPEVINYGGKTYELRYPLSCIMDIVDDVVTIENPMLGIFASGSTPDEAEEMFNEEFDYIYTRYNELPDSKLTEDVKNIKFLLNQIVKR